MATFKTDTEVHLFDDFDTASRFLKSAFEKELKIETEENEWEDVESWHNNDWTAASITHYVGVDHDDCNYYLCTNVKEWSD